MTPPEKPKPERQIRAIQRKRRSLADRFKHLTPEWSDRLIAHCANQDDFSPLIDSLLHDDKIGPRTRAFLIVDFESGKPRKRGTKKTVAQVSLDVEIFCKVVFAMVDNQIKLSAAVTMVAHKLNRPRTSITSTIDRTAPSLPEMMPVKINGRWELPWESANDDN